MLRYSHYFFILLQLFSVMVRAQEAAVEHTLFLAGDAGEPHLRGSPLVKVMRERISRLGRDATVVFLGDNIYPRGMPEPGSGSFEEAETSLRAQAAIVLDLPVRSIFVPGNHDWDQWGKKGLDNMRHQQQWLDSLKNPLLSLIPKDGCPGPVEIPIGNNNLLVILDTQWFLHQWEKTVDESLCGATTPAEVLIQVELIFRRNPGKRIVVAAHHPLVTYGEHGGYFTWKAHLFPFEKFTKYLYLPMPVVGSIYPLYRRWFGHIQDTAHPLYKEFASALLAIMARYPGNIYAAGHEHALQSIVRDSTYLVVSGSASKTEHVRTKGAALLAADVHGFVQVSLHTDRSVTMEFVQADALFPEGKIIYRQTLPPLREFAPDTPAFRSFRDQVVRVRASDRYKAGSARQRWMGTNYRDAWAQEIEVPVFDIGSEQGGLKIIQRGGGQQTLSLRLADSAGRQYVLRSVEKYPEAAIPDMLRNTFAADLVTDQISAAHPYAALAIAPLAEAVGLYHTNPRIVYIPDDPLLGPYRTTFANSMALFEERPDEGWSDSALFGFSGKIVSTAKVIEKIQDDQDNRVDEQWVLLNRLFDLVIGDWDRHEDQWRWATFKDGKNNIYRPIPRDRDQAFFVNEGILPRLVSRRWAMPKFEGFREEIRWPSGLSFNARYFDRSFLTSLSREDWVSAAHAIQEKLTDSVIDDALRQWPEEIYNLHGARIAEVLKARRDQLVSSALSHYLFLARYVDITGSDKSERFEARRLPDGDVQVTIHKITKEGRIGKKLFDRRFAIHETKELRFYGLDGDDVFSVSGTSAKSILIRIIGGKGKDSLTDNSSVRTAGRATLLYDTPEGATFRSGGEVADRTSNAKGVNEYDRRAFRYNRLAPLLYGNYNPDDGVFAGGGFFYEKHGFRKDPYSQRHLLLATVAPQTRSYNFRYQGKFTDVAGLWDLEADADIKAPNFVNNFFGLGNESVFDRDIDERPGISVSRAIQYYRYRFEEALVQVALSRRIGNWGMVKAGPTFQRIEIERPDSGQDRFIGAYANTVAPGLLDAERLFGGLGWEAGVDTRGPGLITRRASFISVSGRNMIGMGDAEDFSAYQALMAFYHSFTPRGRLVFASRVGGGMNRGNYSFFQAQVLDGKTEVRGFRRTRFYGDRKLYANFEARLELARFRSYLFPATLGILAFHDVGRIWYKNENGVDPTVAGGKSRRWHHGSGAGIWFTPFNMTVLSVEAGHSREGTLAYVRMGFLF